MSVTDLKFLDSDRYGEEYENDMFVADVKNGSILYRDLEDKIADLPDKMGEVIFAQGLGGITDMEVGPDGYLYILAINRFHEDNTGTIYRLVPN